MIDNQDKKVKKKKDTIPVSFRMNETLKDKWYLMAEHDRRRPVNWLEVIIEKEWKEYELSNKSNA